MVVFEGKYLYQLSDVELVKYALTIRNPQTVTELETELLTRFVKLSGVTVVQALNFEVQPLQGNTMSLEQALQENTAAVKSLLAVLLTKASIGTNTPEVVANAKVEDAPVVAKTEVKTETKAPKATKAETKAPKVADVDALTLADVSPLIVAIAKEHGKEGAIALMEKFGVKKLGELSADRYAEFKVAAEAILNPETEDEDSLV